MKSSLRLFVTVISLFINTINALSADGKCRILSFRGGGVHGSWEAGVIKGIFENMPAEEIQYDIIAGVSIGAINASLLATYPKGEEQEAKDFLFNMFHGHTSDELFKLKSPVFLAPF